MTTIPMSLTFLRGQAGFMEAQGIRVRVVSSPGEGLLAFSREEGVPVHAVEMPRRITPLRDLAALRELVAEIRRVRPTIVHGHTPKGGLLAMVAATVARVPVRVYHMRGLPALAASGWRRAVLWSSERVACRLAHQVLCVSSSLRREAVRAGICTADRISVLGSGSGNGVDARQRFNPERVGRGARLATRRRFGIPPWAPVIGFVGRVVRDKGIVELADAWAVMRESHPGAHLVVVGPMEPQDPVPRATLDFLGRDPRVHMAGEDWNTPPLYAAMDVVALPSYREGFPNVPLEAGAMELPVVATRVPGCVDAVVAGTTGLLVPVRDAGALAQALERYLVEPELRRAHGAAGRARVLAEFRPETIWRELLEHYRALPAGRPGAVAPVGIERHAHS